MAQRVNVILVDDLDDSQADESVTFGLDGVTYDIDLSDVHAKELREAMAPFVAAARRVGGRKTSKAKAAAVSAPADGKAKPATIREWGLAQGYELPARGRIPADVQEAFYAAQ